jgi:hypothetical protein
VTSDFITLDGIVKAPTQTNFSFPFSNDLVATVRTVFNILEQYAVARTSSENIFSLIQTFVSGIITNTISAYSASTNVSLFSNSTTGNITIGGSQSTGEITIGQTKRIKKLITTQDLTVIQDVIGNSDQAFSFARCYNHKTRGNSNVLDIFRIQNLNGTFYLAQYCELVIGGGNAGLGAFSVKFSFFLWQQDDVTQLVLSGLTTDKSIGGTSTLSYSITNLKDIFIRFQSPTGSTDQNYVATLTTYPTQGYTGVSDFSITAV